MSKMTKQQRERERRTTVERLHRLKDVEEDFESVKARTEDPAERQRLMEHTAGYRQKHREEDIQRGKRVPGFSLQMHQIMWARWIEIADEHEAAASQAFNRISEGEPDLLVEELRQSLCAITAAAYTVEAVFEDVKYLIPERKAGSSAWETIAALLADAFGLSSAQASTLAAEVAWLFHRRNEAVHPYAEPEAPALHPAGINTSAEASRFNGPESRRAMDVALRVLWYAETPPAALNRWVLRWTKLRTPYFREIVHPIRDRRSGHASP